MEELIREYITKLQEGGVDSRVIKFENYNNKFAVLKSKVLIHLELKNKGIVADVDVTDLFEKEIN